MKSLGKISSRLLSEKQTTELKLKTQYQIMIFPQHLVKKLGIKQDELVFNLSVDDSNKLILVGPKLGSQPKSVTSNHERGGFII